MPKSFGILWNLVEISTILILLYRGVDKGNIWGANPDLPTKKTSLNRGVKEF